jgi:hypothetical protein
MRVEPLLCSLVADVAQDHIIGSDCMDPHASERPVDDDAVIDQPRDEPDRPHLAQ